ncbi:hypothetical protein CEXT_422631, partial [Caerostris extrusa]
MCYTEDSDDLEYVSKVVRAIRSATKYGWIMYYKSNAASMDGLYPHEGKRLFPSICILSKDNCS